MKDHEIAQLVNSITKSLKNSPFLDLEEVGCLRQVVRDAVLKGLKGLTDPKPTNLERLQEFSYLNRASIEKSIQCGCYFCLRVFNATEIVDWVDEGQTAVCNSCDIDAIIGDYDDVSASDVYVLAELHERYFCSY